jgi:hypothetical protein
VPTRTFQRVQPLAHIEGRLEEFKATLRCLVCNIEGVHHVIRAIRSQEHSDKLDAYIGEFTAEHAACGLELEGYDPPAFGPAAEKWNYVQTWGGFGTTDPYSARIEEAKYNLDQATRELDSYAQQEWANILNRLLEEQHYFKIKLDQARYELRPTFLQPYLT